MWRKTLSRNFWGSSSPGPDGWVSVLLGKITSAEVTTAWFLKLFSVLHFQKLAFKNKIIKAFGVGFWWVFSVSVNTIPLLKSRWIIDRWIMYFEHEDGFVLSDSFAFWKAEESKEVLSSFLLYHWQWKAQDLPWKSSNIYTCITKQEDLLCVN